MKAKLNLHRVLALPEINGPATIHVIQMSRKTGGKAKKPPVKVRDIKPTKDVRGGTTIIFTFPPQRRPA